MRMRFFINLKRNDNIYNEHFFSSFLNRKRHKSDMIILSRNVLFFSELLFKVIVTIKSSHRDRKLIEISIEISALAESRSRAHISHSVF